MDTNRVPRVGMKGFQRSGSRSPFGADQEPASKSRPEPDTPYWMDGAADVAETTYTPFQTEHDAAPVRFIVRRVKPAPNS